MKNNKNFLSIIIPIYNAEKYLSECLESISQLPAIDNYEIILVNDGSTDESEKICKAYEHNDSRIKYIRQDNKGVSSARNYGIKKSKGNYIMFIDADDFIENKTLKNILENLNDIHIDLVMLKAFKYYSDSSKIPIDGDILIDSSIEFLETISRLSKFPGSACSKIINKEIIVKNNIKFSEDLLNFEDIDFMINIYLNCRKFKALNEPFYYYRQNSEMSASKNLKKRNFDSMINVIEKNAKRKVKSQKDFYKNSFLSYEYVVILLNYSMLSLKDKKNSKKILEYKWILGFTKNKKIKLIYFFSKIFGIKFTSLVLGVLFRLKKKMEE